MTYQGKPVKASRLFAGYEHEQQLKRIGDHFNNAAGHYRNMEFDPEIIAEIQKKDDPAHLKKEPGALLAKSLFGQRSMDEFASGTEAYHQLMFDIVTQQYASTQLVLKGTNVRRLFVDGGFSKNSIYMNLLAAVFPGIEVFAASMAQATAVGTALSIHKAWNKKALPNDIIELKYFSIKNSVSL